MESLDNCIGCTSANFVSGVAQVRRCFEDVVRTFCVKEEAPVSLDSEQHTCLFQERCTVPSLHERRMQRGEKHCVFAFNWSRPLITNILAWCCNLGKAPFGSLDLYVLEYDNK